MLEDWTKWPSSDEAAAELESKQQPQQPQQQQHAFFHLEGAAEVFTVHLLELYKRHSDKCGGALSSCLSL